FEYEFQMAMTNRRMNSDYESMFFITDMKYIYLSSSIVKELAAFNGDISFMVPTLIEKKLKEKFNDI
ncbi:pantetheine-phosphate adenylyltransferase, partial [candidate division WOR-3 bacterium]|nr:pantetheine-phosphate adenylyltransferase [candidate division WOR-3 bacterium]